MKFEIGKQYIVKDKNLNFKQMLDYYGREFDNLKVVKLSNSGNYVEVKFSIYTAYMSVKHLENTYEIVDFFD